LEESREFLRFAPQALEVVVEDRTIGSNTGGNRQPGSCTPVPVAIWSNKRTCPWVGGGKAQAQAGGGQGRLAFDLGFDGYRVRHREAPSVGSENEKAPGW